MKFRNVPCRIYLETIFKPDDLKRNWDPSHVQLLCCDYVKIIKCFLICMFYLSAVREMWHWWKMFCFMLFCKLQYIMNNVDVIGSRCLYFVVVCSFLKLQCIVGHVTLKTWRVCWQSGDIVHQRVSSRNFPLIRPKIETILHQRGRESFKELRF